MNRELETQIRASARRLFVDNPNEEYFTIAETILEKYPNVDRMIVLCAIEDAFDKISN